MRHEPIYEGRPLVRPDEEVVDQGLGFDITTLMNRRRVLRALGLGAAAGLAACASNSTSSSSSASATTTVSSTGLVEIPDETAGPYPGDGSNGPNVLDVLERGPGPELPARGADRRLVRPRELHQHLPGLLLGPWPHIHFEVYPDQASITEASNAIATSQIALPQDACAVVYAQPGYAQSVSNLSEITLATDNVFGDDGGVHELGAVTGDVTAGYTVSLTAPVDTTTTPTAGSAPAGGRGGPPPSR